MRIVKYGSIELETVKKTLLSRSTQHLITSSCWSSLIPLDSDSYIYKSSQKMEEENIKTCRFMFPSEFTRRHSFLCLKENREILSMLVFLKMWTSWNWRRTEFHNSNGRAPRSSMTFLPARFFLSHINIFSCFRFSLLCAPRFCDKDNHWLVENHLHGGIKNKTEWL